MKNVQHDLLTYDTETEQLKVKLKPIFQALRIVKDNQKFCSNKVTTLPKVSNKTVLDYLTKNIEISLKNHVTTLVRLFITKKEPLNEALSKNGADNGNMLQLLAPVIAKELEHLKTDEMLCYA